MMEVHLADDQKAFIRQAIDMGRYTREEDAVQEAMHLWEKRERTRAGILAAVEVAEVSVAHGAGRAISEVAMQELANEVKQRGRARLAGEPSDSTR
jgi:Arc/MetJ-type ribon-helix-helix transcriptional regulator